MVVQTPGQRNNLCDPDLFDESTGYDDEGGIRIAGGLSASDIKQASMLYRLFNGLWGVCIVKGDPGTGKDLFGNYLTWKIKRYFPWKKIMRDEKPREIYGPYGGLFNEQVLSQELSRMKAVAVGKKATDIDAALEQEAGYWVTGAGEVLLKNSVLYLTEFWRYCYNREPHNPMNKTMGAIHKVKRHLDCLILGTVQLPSDLDKKTCLPWIDWQVTCTKSATNKTGFTYFVQKVKYDRREDQLIPLGTTFPISFDAGSPRSYLGDGKIVVRKPNYRPETEEERIVLDVLGAGVNTYEELTEVLETDGDMSAGEVLTVLKELKFRKHKRVIEYPCFFSIYNSKSAPQLSNSLKEKS